MAVANEEQLNHNGGNEAKVVTISHSRHRGRYRIRAVVEMTGVSAATLRAWERRYQIPAPMRSQAAYRLYSDADVDMVRRMCALCHNGHSVAEAAKLVQETTADDARTAADTDPWACYRNNLLLAAENYDVTAVHQQLLAVTALGPASLVYEHVLAPVLVEIGERWHRGAMSVAQEHLLTHAIETTLRNMLNHVQSADALQLALLTCYSGDPHSLALYGIGLRLAGWGFRVVVMTPGLPPAGLRDAVAALRPSVVALSCVQEPQGRDLEHLTAEYAKACGPVPWIVGGAGAAGMSEFIERYGGVRAAANLAEVRNQLAEMCSPRRRVKEPPL